MTSTTYIRHCGKHHLPSRVDVEQALDAMTLGIDLRSTASDDYTPTRLGADPGSDGQHPNRRGSDRMC